MKIRLSPFIATGAACILACSCRGDVAWSGTRPIDPEGWHTESQVVFRLDPEAFDYPYSDRFEEQTAKAINDTAPRLRGNFIALLALRYSEICNAAELDVSVERSSLHGPIRLDTLSFKLFSNDGVPAGKGKFGIYEASVPLSDNLKVEEGSTIAISPLEYDTPVRGISAATLILKRTSH